MHRDCARLSSRARGARTARLLNAAGLVDRREAEMKLVRGKRTADGAARVTSSHSPSSAACRSSSREATCCSNSISRHYECTVSIVTINLAVRPARI